MAQRPVRGMPMEFEAFKASCAEHGYTDRVSDCGKYYVMFTKNGIKTEIKAQWYTVGYGRSQSDLDVLERAFQEHGFPIGRCGLPNLRTIPVRGPFLIPYI